MESVFPKKEKKCVCLTLEKGMRRSGWQNVLGLPNQNFFENSFQMLDEPLVSLSFTQACYK